MPGHYRVHAAACSLYVYTTISMISPLGSGGGSVGRMVTSDTRDPWDESRLRKILSTKDENKEKQAGMGPSLKK